MKRGARHLMIAVALGAAGLAGAGCESSTDEAATADDGSRRGELVIYTEDNFDTGVSRTTYFLKDALGTEMPLHFDSNPGLAPGTRIKAWGAQEGAGLRVTSFERLVTPQVTTIQSGLIGATPFAARSFAFVLVDIGGGLTPVRWDNVQNDLTETFLMGRLINDDDSLRNYYLGDSYQMQDVTARVIGPLAYPLSSSCDTSNMASSLRSMVDAQGGPFQHYLWFFGTNTSSCNWSGLASVGTPQSPQRNTWYNHSVGCVVLIQEPGHNFGMQHSSNIKCGTSTFHDVPSPSLTDTAMNNCTTSEYGDPFDPMGGGCRHMNAWQKSFQGWLAGCNGVKVTNSGTFNILPLEMSCNGPQFLQIKAPKARQFRRPAAGGGNATTEDLDYYYLELRTPFDFDGTLGGGSGLSARVLVHVAAELRTRTDRGLHTFLLDMTPTTSTFNDAAMAVGQTYTDPAGSLSFTLQSVSNSGATIQVNYTSGGTGSPVCMDGSAFTAPGPGIETCNATPMPTGAGGTTGAAGTSGGRGGTTGAGGRGGTTGAGGRGGTTGAAGTTGVTGAAGMPSTGSAGTNGAAGTTGQGQAGSTMPVGSGGEGGSGAGGDGPPMDRGISGGCACDTAASGSPATPGVAALMLGVWLAVGARRPRRQRSRARRR